MQVGYETDSSPSGAELKISGAVTPLPVCFCGMCMDCFTFISPRCDDRPYNYRCIVYNSCNLVSFKAPFFNWWLM